MEAARTVRGVPLREIVDFLDGYLNCDPVADSPKALNGLQVEASGPVKRFAVAVDASEAVIEAVRDRADLLIVHHGLFWAGLRPLTGPHYRRVRALIESGTALYSSHHPLDAHPEVGNAAVLADALGLTSVEPFGTWQGASVGVKGRVVKGRVEGKGRAHGWGGRDPRSERAADSPPGRALADLVADLSGLLGGEVTTLPGGPSQVASVGIVTGAGAFTVGEAADQGLDVLITGEAHHYHAIEAAELGVTILLGGHYATETWGVKKVAELLTERFGIEGHFVDSPTGL